MLLLYWLHDTWILKLHSRKSSNLFSVHTIKHKGFRLWETSHQSHNENDSHLNAVIKENLKRCNETILIKTSCSDERRCRWDTTLFTLWTHKHAGAHLRSEFVVHILSAGCVMTPVIKVGNCLTEVLRYWIRGQFCRHNRRRVDVKSLSSEIGSRAEQTHRRWYQHQRQMLALCWLTLVNGIQSTCYPIPPWDSHWLCPLAFWNQTLHDYSSFSSQRSATDHIYTKASR